MSRGFSIPLLVVAVVLAGASNGLLGQMLYVGNFGDGTISSYVIDQESGRLTELLPRVASNGSPTSVAVHPNKKFVYVTNGGRAAINAGPSLAALSIDGTTGALTLLGNTPLAPGSSPLAVAIDPSGKFAFVAHQAANYVSVFSIDPSTGATTAVSGSPFATPQGPSSVVAHPNGKFLYVSASGQVAVFAIGADGALTSAEGSPFAARNNMFWMTMDPAGKFLFAVERQDNAVLVYAVNDTTGALTPVTGSPFRAGPGVSGVAVDPAGKFLFVSTASDGGVSVFTIGATGALTQLRSFGAIVTAFAVILDPSGKFLYVPGQQANAVAALAIDPDSGGLTRLDQAFFPAGVQPQRGATVLLDPPILPPIISEGAFNAFSVAIPGMPNAGVAQGSLLGITGKNIGPAEGVEVSFSPSDFPLKPELGGASIQIQSGDVTTAALMITASNNKLMAIVPSTTPLGEATVTVTYRGRTSAPLPITIVTTSVGIDTRNEAGSGPAGLSLNATPETVLTPETALSFFSSSDLLGNALHRSARPGQRMMIGATGLGPAAFDETQPLAQAMDVPLEVIVGNKPAAVISKVRVAGFDFILLQLPDDAPDGCYVPLAFRAGGVTSNVASISISATGASCSDAHGLAASDIEAAQSSGQFRFGTIILNHFDFPPLGVFDGAVSTFGRLDFGSLRDVLAPTSYGGDTLSSFAPPPPGSCTVSPGLRTRPDDLFDVPRDPASAQPLNPGQTLNLSGPQGTLQLTAPSYRAESETNVITEGDYTVDNGTGTREVGPFKAVLSLPPMVTWTNKEGLTSADRTQDLTVTWSGGDPSKELVVIIGIAAGEKATAGFLCTEKVSAGTFTVPAWVLSSLPASATFTLGDQSVPGGLLGVGTTPLTNAGRFTATGLDFGVFTYERATVTLVSYQ